jgi:hypothetical protein
VWDIQILTQAPADWGSLNTGNRGKAWYRYGLWSERDGLAHRPLAAQSKDRQLRRDSEYLIEQVRSNPDSLPYALADRRELWLLDAEQKKPLALLHAMLPDAENQQRVQRYIDWAAPALLTLPYLNDSQRTRLESSLSDQAVSIEYHWRLYPKVLDKNKLIASRVKAGLQGNGAHEPDA